eukprot:5597267-Prymnesium_polylepis.1
MAGMSNDHIARVATHVLAQEEMLRGKQNQITESINENLQTLSDEVLHVRRTLDRIVGSRASTNTQQRRSPEPRSYNRSPGRRRPSDTSSHVSSSRSVHLMS